MAQLPGGLDRLIDKLVHLVQVFCDCPGVTVDPVQAVPGPGQDLLQVVMKYFGDSAAFVFLGPGKFQ